MDSTYLDFLQKCCCPVSFCRFAKRNLILNGFQEVDFKKQSEIPKKGFYNRDDRSIVAYNIGGYNSMVICASHSDSPCLKLMPVTDILKNGYICLNTASYAGGLSYSWFGRDLRLTGTIYFRNGENIESSFIDSERGIAFLPFANSYTPEKDILSLEIERDESMKAICAINGIPIIEYISKELSITKEQIISSNLYLSDAFPPQIVNSTFVSSGRLDNLSSAYASLVSFIESTPYNNINVFAVYDHEEIGSFSHWGALNDQLETIISYICNSAKIDPFSLKSKSLIISADASHNKHPCYIMDLEEKHPIFPSKGVILKTTGTTSTGNNVFGVLVIKEAAKRANTMLQMFSRKNVANSGGTIGPKMEMLNSINTIDIGASMWAMHSSRETMSLCDENSLIKLIKTIYQQYESIRDKIG